MIKAKFKTVLKAMLKKMNNPKISFAIAKYLTLLLCLFTVMLTTPWGSKLTISLINTIDGFHFDYKSGALVRDIELNGLKLNFDSLNIEAENVAAQIDFSCIWSKKLCVDSLRANSFTLTYQSKNNDNYQEQYNESSSQLFTLPFAIDAKKLAIQHSHIVINQAVFDIEEFSTELALKKSDFLILQPSANELTVTLSNTSSNKAKSMGHNNVAKKTDKANNENKPVYTLVSELSEINLPIALAVQNLHLDELSVIYLNNVDLSNVDSNSGDANKNKEWYSQNNKLTAHWVKNTVKIKELNTVTPDYSVSNLRSLIELTPPYKIDASANTHILNSSHKLAFWPEIADSKQDISLKGSLDNLTITLASNDSKTDIIFRSQAHINLTVPELPFSFNLTAEKLPLPLSLAENAEPSVVSLSVKGDVSEQSLSLNSQINSYGYSNANLHMIVKHHEGLLTFNELTFNDKKSNSQVTIEGSIDAFTDNISWDIFANSTGFTLPTINLKKLSRSNNTKTKNNSNTPSTDKSFDLSFDSPLTLPFEKLTGRVLGNIASKGLWTKDNWNLSLKNTDVSGKVNNSNLVIKGDITLNSMGHLSSGNDKQNKLQVEFNHSKLSLQTYQSEHWNLKGRLTVNKLDKWYTSTRGSFNSKFTLKGNSNDPTLTLESEFKALNWQKNTSSFASHSSIYSPSIKLSGSYQPFSAHKTSLYLHSNTIQIVKDNPLDTMQENLSIEELTLSLVGDLNQHKLDINWQGNVGGAIILDGQWHDSDNTWNSQVRQYSLAHQNFTWQNNNAFNFNIDIDKKALLIEKHCLAGEGLKVCLPDNATLGNSGNITLDLNLDLAVIDQLFMPENIQLKSKITGELNAHWSATQPITANADLSLSSGHIKVSDDYSDQKISQWNQGKLILAANQKNVKGQFVLRDKYQETLVDINSTVSFVNRLTSDAIVSSDTTFGELPITADISLQQFDLQPFQSIIRGIVSLQGKLSAILAVEGKVNSPLISGNLALEQGELLLQDNPNKLQKIDANIQINNNIAELNGEFYLEDDKANITGELAFKDSLAVNIDLNAEQLPLIFPPQLGMKVSPAINFNLANNFLLISGNINVLEGSYNIEKLPEGSIKLSNDVIIVDAQGKEIFKDKSIFDIKTDISVNINESFKITGQGLQSNLFGQLQIQQQNKQPLQLFGNIASSKGSYKAYGQKLTIEKGELTFSGPITTPYLNLRASRHIKAEDIEVGLEITGLADALNIQLFSTPTMEPPEMLSYLVRGRSLDTGGGNSTAAASMLIGFGITNSVGLFDKLEKLPLISNIAVDTEGEGDTTQATISGYLGNRIYLKYGIGVYEPINELTVRMYLLNRFWLEVVSNIETSTDLYYSFDID